MFDTTFLCIISDSGPTQYVISGGVLVVVVVAGNLPILIRSSYYILDIFVTNIISCHLNISYL